MKTANLRYTTKKKPVKKEIFKAGDESKLRKHEGMQNILPHHIWHYTIIYTRYLPLVIPIFFFYFY